MKWVRQITKSIVELTRNNKLFLAVVLIGLMLSETGFLFFTGFATGLYIDNTMSNLDYRIYTIKGLNNDESFKAIAALEQYNKNFNFIIATDPVPTKNGKAIIISSSSNKISYIFSGRQYEIKMKKDECVVTRSLINLDQKMNHIGTDFALGSKSLHIRAIMDRSNYFGWGISSAYINFHQAKSMDFKITRLHIISENLLNDEDYLFIKKAISSISENPEFDDYYFNNTSSLDFL